MPPFNLLQEMSLSTFALASWICDEWKRHPPASYGTAGYGVAGGKTYLGSLPLAAQVYGPRSDLQKAVLPDGWLVNITKPDASAVFVS
jgi:hypothetical protein